jgi:hypothetical protein
MLTDAGWRSRRLYPHRPFPVSSLSSTPSPGRRMRAEGRGASGDGGSLPQVRFCRDRFSATGDLRYRGIRGAEG